MLVVGHRDTSGGVSPRAIVGASDAVREVLTQQAPKCWCALAAPGKLLFRPANDRLNPGRAFYQVRWPFPLFIIRLPTLHLLCKVLADTKLLVFLLARVGPRIQGASGPGNSTYPTYQ